MDSSSTVAETPSVRWRVIEARGEETLAFLQGQLSCDLGGLGADRAVRGLVLEPSGEVITSVRCVGHPLGVDLIVREELAEAAAARLRRFLMRTRCHLTVGAHVAGDYDSAAAQVDLGAPGPAEFDRRLTPHSFGVGFVDEHVSFTKGCFTGQELVGRLDARGASTPFRLARLSADDRDALVRVAASAGPSGERALQGVSTLAGDGPARALGIVHRSLLGERREALIDGVTVELLHCEKAGR